MEINWTSLIGIGFFALALWRAVRVRRDLEAGETHWDSALFGRREPIFYARTPVKFWCAIMVNAAIVMLLALVGAVAFRALSLAMRR